MLVAVIGNYQSTNVGDDMYVHLLQERYPEHRFLPQHKIRDRKPHFLLYGGGGVLRESEGRRDMMHEWAIKYRAPYGVFSVGSAAGDALAFSKNPFPKAEFVTVRDEASARALPGSVLAPDLAWTFDPGEPPEDVDGPYMGVMLRYSGRHNALAMVHRARDEMNAWPGHPKRYLFFSTYGERLADRSMVYPVGAGFRYKYPLYNGIKPAEYLEHFWRCERVIAMPMHGMIFASVYGVPWAAWSYSTKTDWLASDLGAAIATSVHDGLRYNHISPDRVAKMRRAAEAHFEVLDEYFL